MAHCTPLHRAAAEAVAAQAGVDADALKVVAPPRPEMGDLAVGCFAFGGAPAAAKIAAAFRPTDLLDSASAAGPFVNFRANRTAAFRWLAAGDVLPKLGEGKTICIDFGSPNISK